MTLPASAHHDETAKTSKGDETTYVGLGLGDHLILCRGMVVPVSNPTDICLGGADSIQSGGTPPTIQPHWQVWAEDLVFEAIQTNSVDLVPSMFARMTAEAHRSTTTVNPFSCVPPASAPRICETTTFSETQFKVLAQFSACGKAGVTGIDADAFTDLIAFKGTYDTYTVTKQVFVNGPIFFSLDCGVGGNTLAPLYNDFVRWFNNDPSDPPTGPFSNMPQVPSTCEPGLPTGGFVCLFWFPVGGSKCWTEGEAPKDPWSAHHETLPGIIGTIGWNHDDPSTNLDCLEVLGDGPWTKTTRSSTGFQVQDFPGQALTDPVECLHAVVNAAGCSTTPIPTPGTPVGGSLICNYTGGEVGGEVHAGALSLTYCYSVDPDPASCGGDPGVAVVENGDSFDQCIDPAGCTAPYVGHQTTSSIDAASHQVCVDPASSCDGGGVAFFGAVGSTSFSDCIPLPSSCGPPAPSPGWGVSVAGICVPLAWVTQTNCTGLVGTEIAVGHPFTGELTDLCL